MEEKEEKEDDKTCMVCGETKASLTEYNFSHRRLIVCKGCNRRINEGKDQDYENLFQALVELGEYD